MRFIHIADIHLGAEPDGLKHQNKTRGQEIWESFERLLAICEPEELDLLLIAGDLFHRQPLLRELKEVNFLFSKLTKTQVVLIAGNHDYMKPDSYYHTFSWNHNVHFLGNGHMGCVEFPEWKTAVYGFSYYQKEIVEPLYDRAVAPKKQACEILLAHGGDEKHIPVKKEVLANLGYDYVALGHIHKHQVLLENRIAYAGSLEPTDQNDLGVHGYIQGEMQKGETKIWFVPFARREYRHLTIEVDATHTAGEVKDRIVALIREHGIEHMYRLVLRGFCDVDIRFDLEVLQSFGNIIEILDETKPSYDMEQLLVQNVDNLLGKYIANLREAQEGTLEHQALYEGVHALMSTKRG